MISLFLRPVGTRAAVVPRVPVAATLLKASASSANGAKASKGSRAARFCRPDVVGGA